MHNVDFEKNRKEIDTMEECLLKEQGKVKWKPKVDCCSHYNTDTFTVGYLAKEGKLKPSKFEVYICDNCGEVHLPYGGIKGFLAGIYFKICGGCILVPEVKQED